MLIHELLLDHLLPRDVITPILERDLYKIRTECSHFIQCTEHNPVYKVMERKHQDFCKVKARARSNRSNSLNEIFNRAFGDHVANIRQRSIYTSSHLPLSEHDASTYYVFIPDGFDYLYNTQISDSSVYESIDSSVDPELLIHLIPQQYNDTNLHEAFESDTEIMFYNVPHFYAINTSSVSSYSQLLAAIATASRT